MSRSGVKRAARAILTVCLLGSLVFTAFNIREVLRSPIGGLLAVRALDEVDARLQTLWQQTATPQAIADRLDALIEEDPRNWVAIDAVLEAAAEDSIVLPPPVLERVELARDEDNGTLKTLGKCATCGVLGKECTLGIALACRAPMDMSPIGDVRGVVVESAHWVMSEDVDEVEFVLSAVGLTSVAAIAVSGGTSMTLKAGAGTLKIARRVGALTKGISDMLVSTAKRAVDWSRVGEVRIASLRKDIGSLLRHDEIAPLKSVATSAQEMYAAVGMRHSLLLLKHVDNASEAKGLAAAAKSLKRRTAGLLELAGKNRVLRAAMRWSDEVWWMITGIFGMLVAVLGLMWSTFTSLSMRILRRLAR